MGGEGGGLRKMFKAANLFFWSIRTHAKFQNRSFTPSGLCMKIGSTDSGGYVKFTPKYIIVGGEGGVSDFFLRLQSYSFGHLGPYAKFQNRSLHTSGLYLVSRRRRKIC